MVLYDSAVVGKMIAVGWLAMELEIRWALVLYDSAVVGKTIAVSRPAMELEIRWASPQQS